MRIATIALFAVVASLLGETEVSNAQSAYSYPWCAIYWRVGGGARSCYYTSYEQCMTTVFPIGGYCVPSPYYHPQPTQPPHARAKPRHRLPD
jgi:Protein of unknown function (DUF3551)